MLSAPTNQLGDLFDDTTDARFYLINKTSIIQETAPFLDLPFLQSVFQNWEKNGRLYQCRRCWNAAGDDGGCSAVYIPETVSHMVGLDTAVQ